MGHPPVPVLVWESTREPYHADESRVRETEAKLEDMSRRLREVMENDELREAAPEAHLADVKRRQSLVDEASEERAAARATTEQNRAPLHVPWVR